MNQDLISQLSQDELLTKTAQLAEVERHATLSVLYHLAEVERRRSFVKIGYASLWDYAIKGLKYSESAAYQRISAMHALKNNPELEEKLRSGALTVSIVSQVQNVLKAERQQAYRDYSASQREELFKKCEKKTSKEVTEVLIGFSPLALRVQKERAITGNRTEISFIADSELVGKIRRVRDLSVARLRAPSSYPELMDLMSEVVLDEIDPLRKPDREPRGEQVASASGAISPLLRRKIWKEFGGRCGFVSPETGERCGSTFGLEVEHCKPHSMGGSSKDASNLMVLCKQHNQWRAIQSYGLAKMDPYLN